MIMSQSEHIDNKKKHMLIYKDGPTKWYYGDCRERIFDQFYWAKK